MQLPLGRHKRKKRWQQNVWEVHRTRTSTWKETCMPCSIAVYEAAEIDPSVLRRSSNEVHLFRRKCKICCRENWGDALVLECNKSWERRFISFVRISAIRDHARPWESKRVHWHQQLSNVCCNIMCWNDERRKYSMHPWWCIILVLKLIDGKSIWYSVGLWNLGWSLTKWVGPLKYINKKNHAFFFLYARQAFTEENTEKKMLSESLSNLKTSLNWIQNLNTYKNRHHRVEACTVPQLGTVCC